MGKDFEISDKINNYIKNLSKELHPVQKEIIAYNKTLGESKKMQIAIKSFRQCGSERFIAEDSDIQEILTLLTKKKTLS